MTKTAMSSDMMQRAVPDALECSRISEKTLVYCLRQGGRYAEAKHIELIRDCAETCRTSAVFIERGSPFTAEIARVCAGVCGACAEDCASFTGDDQMMRCAEVCRRCAESCRQMAAAAV